MKLQKVCVKNSVHGGGADPGKVSQHALRQTSPQQMATAADGTHPTGIHSCDIFNFLLKPNQPVKVSNINNRNA